MPRKPQQKATRRRGGKDWLPNEHRRHSLVVVDRVSFAKDADELGRHTAQYAVETRRLDKDWQITVTPFTGDVWAIPAKVLDRLISQRESIIKQQRSDRARERQEQLRVVNE
jgi:hypothetical protein